MDKDSNKTDSITQEKTENQEIKKPDFEVLKNQLKDKIKKKREKAKIEPQDLKIKVTAPEGIAKQQGTPTKKTLAKITPDQMNMLVNGLSNTVCFIRHTEDVSLDESAVFSRALYEIAEANGWLDDLTFLPYLVLIAAGTQLTVTIMTKPKKAGYVEKSKQVFEKDVIKEEVQKVPELPKGTDYDVINSDELVKKINGL